MSTQSLDEQIGNALRDRRALGRRFSVIAVANERRRSERRAVPGWPGLLAELIYASRKPR